MKHSEVKPGRVFVIRLEDGDIIHECIERFAEEQKISAATLTIVGGIAKGSKLVVGPEDENAETIVPKEYLIHEMHEVTGTGTLFPDEDMKPVLHMHMACGRDDQTLTGCIQRGVKTWHVLEVIVTELTQCNAKRIYDPETGFKLLNP